MTARKTKCSKTGGYNVSAEVKLKC